MLSRTYNANMHENDSFSFTMKIMHDVQVLVHRKIFADARIREGGDKEREQPRVTGKFTCRYGLI